MTGRAGDRKDRHKAPVSGKAWLKKTGGISMAEGCFIGIDQGSSATKAVVVASAGQIIFQTRKDLAPPFRDGLRIEQDPREVLDSVRNALNESVLAIRSSGIPFRGIGLSCQRSSCLAWNETTGEPLSPVISWRDTRGLDLVDSLAGQAAMIFKTSGLPLTPYYSASKLRWLKDNLSASQRDGALFGTLSSFPADGPYLRPGADPRRPRSPVRLHRRPAGRPPGPRRARKRRRRDQLRHRRVPDGEHGRRARPGARLDGVGSLFNGTGEALPS